jgi:hypothetical protein
MTFDDELGRWVRVEFYGLVPPGMAVVDVDLPAVAETLMRGFGFAAIDGLTAAAAAGRRRRGAGGDADPGKGPVYPG